VANRIKNVFNSKAFQIFAAVFALSLFTNQQVRAQYSTEYTPDQQQPAPATPQETYPQSYQQPAQQNYQQPAQLPVQPASQPAQPAYEQHPSFLTDEEPAPDPDKGASDHEQAVGQFGLALLGIMSMPILESELDETTGLTVPRLADDAALSAPTLGLRYWLSKMFGLEAGVGLGLTEGSFEELYPDRTIENEMPSITAFTFHVGAPIALLYSRHFVFELVPIVNGGLSTGTITGPMPADVAAVDPTAKIEWNVSTFLLQAGARVGAEIHFGFIGVEQLAVQASLGLRFSYLSASAEMTGYAENSSKTSLGTTAGSKPWDLFTENLSAIYYIY